jgi:hypothetical protein
MKMTLENLGAAALLSLAAASATAGEAYLGVATTGVELGYGLKLDDRSGLRIDADFLRYHRSFNTSDVDYDAKLKFANAGVFYDWFLGDTFRLSGGALIGTRKLDGTGKPSGGTITINGVAYSAAGESLSLDARFPTVSPYIGLGWGHRQGARGAGFYADLGTAIGRPKVDLTATPGLVAAAGQSNIDAERQAAQDKADKLRFYPVVKLGFGYAF